MQKLKKTRRKQKQTERNRRNTEKLKEKHKQQQKYRISSPRTSAKKMCDLFAEVRGLDILYFCCFYVFLRVVLFSFEFLCVSFLCCYMCFFDCKCKHLKILGENINKQQKETKTTTEQLEEKHKNNRNT